MLTCETKFGGPSVIGWKVDDGIEQLGGHQGGGFDLTLMHVASDCLAPIATAGEHVLMVNEIPTPWQLCAFVIRGDSFGRLKIFIGFHDRGEQRLELFGDDQPDRLAIFAAINPLEIYVVAERDLARLRPVKAVGALNSFRDVSAGVTVTAEQWQAIIRALGA